jgi:hypothetical protein
MGTFGKSTLRIFGAQVSTHNKLYRGISEFLIVFSTQLLVSSVDLIQIFNPRERKVAGRQEIIGIEAGTRGWDSIYFKELFTSASDYFGPEKVILIEVSDRKERMKQLRKIISGYGISYLVYDPRTNYSKPLLSMLQAFQVNLLCWRKRVTVLVSLTDPSLRTWRLQSAIASRRTGAIFTPMDISKLGWLCWRLNISGPHFMPVSKQTFLDLESRAVASSITNDSFRKLEFRGTLYPTRSAYFNEINRELEQHRSQIRIETKQKSEFEISPSKYWSDLVSAQICITTTFQYVYTGYHVDRSEINQMVFRISEALAAGNLLFTSECPGIDKYFSPGEEIVIFSSPEELALKLIELSQNLSEANRIRTNGIRKMKSLVMTGAFWNEILQIEN